MKELRNGLVSLSNVTASKSEPRDHMNVNIEIHDSITAEYDTSSSSVCAIFTRRLSSTPNYVDISVAFSIRYPLEVSDISDIKDKDFASLVINDKTAISSCTSRASLMISQITNMMFSNVPIITPPEMITD